MVESTLPVLCFITTKLIHNGSHFNPRDLYLGVGPSYKVQRHYILFTSFSISTNDYQKPKCAWICPQSTRTLWGPPVSSSAAGLCVASEVLFLLLPSPLCQKEILLTDEFNVSMKQTPLFFHDKISMEICNCIHECNQMKCGDKVKTVERLLTCFWVRSLKQHLPKPAPRACDVCHHLPRCLNVEPCSYSYKTFHHLKGEKNRHRTTQHIIVELGASLLKTKTLSPFWMRLTNNEVVCWYKKKKKEKEVVCIKFIK